MKFKLISTHLRSVTDNTGTDSKVVGLYMVIDEETEATPYMVSQDPDSERMWISKESAAEMLREDGAEMAAKAPIRAIIDLLGDGQ